jgi:sec-independent protein translocase protein TatA|tara:strand:+ start:412 stop:756 length:345 start_codon:yes stop_codon:yes gene_type:complete
VLEYALNIIGTEWIIIIFIGLILLFGTNRFPDVAKKIGKLVGEYSNAKNQIENEMKNSTNQNLQVSGPVKDERKKLEMMATQLEINYENKTDDELRKIIESKIGESKNETQTKK